MALAALVQTLAGPDKRQNLEAAERWLAWSAARGAQLAVLPESFMAHLPASAPNQARWELAEAIDGPFVTALAGLARRHRLWVVFGMYERPRRPQQDGRVWNTAVLLDTDGRLVAAYRKTHLYDAFGGAESAQFMAGSGLLSPIVTPVGKLGLLVCYELRFPEVARAQALAGAEVLAVPSAWYQGPLKEDHWSTFVRARALENTCYVLAADLTGSEFVGRSQAADPLGIAVADAGEEPGAILVAIDPGRLAAARSRFPWPGQRRPELYGSLAAPKSPT